MIEIVIAIMDEGMDSSDPSWVEFRDWSIF